MFFSSLELLLLYIKLARDIRVLLRGQSDMVNSSIINYKSESNSEGLHTNKLLVTIRTINIKFLDITIIIIMFYYSIS